MAKSYKIKDGIICVKEEIEIIDYALYLKYDWHLYNLSKDIRNARDKGLRDYLKKANELFEPEIALSKPNKRVDLFGTHSVFYFLYGHTGDWVSWSEKETVFLKDLFVCVSGKDAINRLFRIIRESEGYDEAVQEVSRSFGIQPVSAARMLGWKQERLLTTLPDEVSSLIAKEVSFLTRISELREFDNL